MTKRAERSRAPPAVLPLDPLRALDYFMIVIVLTSLPSYCDETFTK